MKAGGIRSTGSALTTEALMRGQKAPGTPADPESSP